MSDVAEIIDMLCGRVGELEVALKDVIDERLQGDNRQPQAALTRAIDVLRQRKREAAPCPSRD